MSIEDTEWKIEFENGHIKPEFIPNSYINKPDKASKKKLSKVLLKGTLEESGEIEYETENFKIPLKFHQRRSLYAMNNLENSKYRFSSRINMGILSDKVGSGKSALVLSLIDKYPIINSPMGNILNLPGNVSGLNFDLTNMIYLPINIIVVPHSVYFQWEGYIKTFTNLNFTAIRSKLDIGKMTKDLLIKNPIVLIKSTMFNDWVNKIEDLYAVGYDYSYEYKKDTTSSKLDILRKEVSLLNETVNVSSYSGLSIEQFQIKLELAMDILNQRYLDYIDEVKTTKDNTGKYPLNEIYTYNGGLLFERVIFDEANSIRIPACKRLMGKMNWFITSSLLDLMFPRGDHIKNVIVNGIKTTVNIDGINTTGFIRDSFIENSYLENLVLMSQCLIKNSDETIEKSFKLPNPKLYYISCLTPVDLAILNSNNAINNDTLKALNAGDLQSALQSLGCETGTEEGILDIVVGKLKIKQIDLKEKIKEKRDMIELLTVKKGENMELYEELKLKSKNKIINETEKVIYEEMKEEKEHLGLLIGSNRLSLENFTKQLKDVEDKIDGIEGRIKDIDDKSCPICSQKINQPVMTPCCKNIFCLECLIMAISYAPKSACPMCMISIEKTKLRVIMKSGESKKTINELPTKDERLKELLEKYKDGRFLIFSEFDGSFLKIGKICDELGILCSKVNGTPGHIKNVIDKFTSGEYKVLLLNAKNFGAGLNLQMTTDIILYHNMSSDLEKQVIGRGQRLGRTTSLRIHYLTYEHEYTDKKKIISLDEEPEVIPDIVDSELPIVNTDDVVSY